MTRFRFAFDGIVEAEDQHKAEEVMEEFRQHSAVKECDYEVSEAGEVIE